MKTKVGSPGDDPEQVRRYAIAIPSAIAITALLVAVGRLQPVNHTVAEQPPAATVRLERAPPTPRPTPKPTPKPTPPPILKPVVRVTLAPVPQRAGVVTPRPAGGAHAARHAPPHPAVAHTFAVPQAAGGNGTAVAAGSGEGTGSGDAVGSGDAGGGSVNADAPCGVVDLIPFQSPDRRGAITNEYIRATVTFPDGHTQSEDFPYHFSYTDPADDPWSAQNMRNDNFITRVQLPPPGANTSRFPELIRYIIDHTRQNGTTVLQECPRQR
jgi:hypothetical protein